MPPLYFKEDAAPTARHCDRRFLSLIHGVMCRVLGTPFHPEIREPVVALLAVDMMDHVSIGNELPSSQPPHEMMLVDVPTTVAIAGIAVRCDAQLVRSNPHEDRYTELPSEELNPGPAS